MSEQMSEQVTEQVTDNVATHRRRRVADPLREFSDSITDDLDDDTYWMRDELYRISDQIDREHERRMEQSREDSRKATCNYMSRIIADYKRGKKWKRKEYQNGQKH